MKRAPKYDPPMDKIAAWRNLPKGIWAMGFGSLFMDISSELVHSLLPVFMVTTLGVSMVTVGVIEGVAEAVAAFTKVFSGALSDFLRKRKGLMIFGYALAALTKPIFPMAQSIAWVFGARFIDRIGKGIRGAPRDALIADIAPAHLRGAAYGLRQSLDSVGAFLGPALAVALMLYWANDIRAVLWFAVVPAVIAVLLLVYFVQEPATTTQPHRPVLSLNDAKRLPKRFWLIVLIGAVLTLARFSEAFLILRADDIGLGLALVPAIMIVMNVFYAAAAYPAGVAADRINGTTLLILGTTFLIAADLVLAFASSALAVFLGAALWGLHMALTQGLLAKLVADTAPPGLVGTSFGLFNMVSGVALLLASVIAGLLWSQYGASTTFFTGAAFAIIASIGLVLVQHKSP